MAAQNRIDTKMHTVPDDISAILLNKCNFILMSLFAPDTVFLPTAARDVNQPALRVNVVKSTDSNRGFRLFDNAVFVVRDVASEELFLERVRIAYSVFERVVEPHMDTSMFALANQIVLATKVCIAHYFNAQSMAKTNRPFIVKAEYRDSPSLFCGCSDFLRAYLYTKTTGDPFIDDETFDATNRERNVEEGLRGLSSRVTNDDPHRPLTQRELELEACRLKWQLGSMHAKWMIEGGPKADLNILNPDAIDPDRYGTNFAEPSRPEAVLYLIADTTALAEFLCYMFYMTPVELKRRYEVNTGCTASSVSSSTADRLTRQAKACCYDESNRYNSSDTVRRAIQEFLRRKQKANELRRDDIYNASSISDVDPMFAELLRKEQSGARATRLRNRNDTLVKNLLLLLFDKALSSIIDNGFDNANKRRRYGTNSKTIGGATVYTGILDTVGKVVVRYKEGVSLSQERKATTVNTPKSVRKSVADTFINFRLPTTSDVEQNTAASQNERRNVAAEAQTVITTPTVNPQD